MALETPEIPEISELIETPENPKSSIYKNEESKLEDREYCDDVESFSEHSFAQLIKLCILFGLLDLLDCLSPFGEMFRDISFICNL